MSAALTTSARIAAMTAEASSIAGNLERIRKRMARAAERCGRRTEEITLVAVSKTFAAEEIRAAHGLGLRHFGENRVQEWEEKRKELEGVDATWHLIGHLQSNKARRAANLFNRVDSLDSFPLAQKLDAAAAGEGAEGEGKRLGVLIEVSLGNEEAKSGVAEAELPGLAEGITALAHLELLGLMTIPPFFEDVERVRPFFAKLRGLRDEVSGRLGRRLPVLSMGMSHDFEIAIEEGATEVRVGTALFGARRSKL
jgi:pyridoxal phosphate enzyme (YggS family)